MAAGARQDRLAAYALDGLEQDEREDLERHLVACKRCRRGLEQLTLTAATLALTIAPAEPPPALRKRILAGARQERQETTKRASVSLHPLRPRPTVLGLAAAVTVLVATTSYRLLDGSPGLSPAAQAQAFLARPDIKQIPLQGANGLLAVNPRGDALLIVHRLPRAPHGRTYEIWVAHDNRPLPAGIFPGGDQTSTVKLTRPLTENSVVAVSIERAGGSATPHGHLVFATTT